MSEFIISSQDCLLLKALRDAPSLREASRALGKDPAGLARRAYDLSTKHSLLQKINNRWQLTSKGVDLVAWAEQSVKEQSRILDFQQSLTIGAPPWFIEEVLFPYFNALKDHFKEITKFNFISPQKGFDVAIMDGSVDFVICCHPPEKPDIAHKRVVPEEWVFVGPRKWFSHNADQSKILEQMQRHPFIQHMSINLDALCTHFEQANLNKAITVNSFTSAKAAVEAGLGWTVIPKILIHRNLKKKNKVIEIPLKLSLSDRHLCLWSLRSRTNQRKMMTRLSFWIKENLREI